MICSLLIVASLILNPFQKAAAPKLSAATPVLIQPGAKIVGVGGNEKLLTPLEYANTNLELTMAIDGLNRAELKSIHGSQVFHPNGSRFSLARQYSRTAIFQMENNLMEVAARAMQIAQVAEDLSGTAAAQNEGSAAAAKTAEQYASIARLSYALVIEAQNLREGIKNGTLSPVTANNVLAEYGAQLWNPAVTENGKRENPFLPYVVNQNNILPTQFLNNDAAEQLKKAKKSATTPLSWLATSNEMINKVVVLPATASTGSSPYNKEVLKDLTTINGQVDAERARQVAAVHLKMMTAAGESSSPQQAQIPVFKSAAVADASQIAADSIPTYPEGRATMMAKSMSGEDLVDNLYVLSGQAPPEIEGQTPVKETEPMVVISITSAQEKSRIKDRSGYLGVFYDIKVSWTSRFISPSFSIGCVGGTSVNVSGPSGIISTTAFNFVQTNNDVEIYCRAYRRTTLDCPLAQTSLLIRVEGNTVDTPTFTQTSTVTPTPTPTPTHTVTLTKVPTWTPTVTLDKTQDALGTQEAGTKTAEFQATITEIARKTEDASKNKIFTLNGSFGLTKGDAACDAGYYSSGSLKIVVDLKNGSASGTISGSGSASKSALVCNNLTYDQSCTVSYSGSVSGSVDPVSGAINLSGSVSGSQQCSFSNCKESGLDVPCGSSGSSSTIADPVSITGIINTTSLTGNGSISTCGSCQGSWSGGQ